MIPQFDNLLLPSTILWADNVLLQKGQAYYNVNSKFYPINSYYNNLYAYASPFKQFAYDNSISGANVMTGIYVDGVFTTTGQRGFVGVNYEEGLAIFSAPQGGLISGNFAVKEISTKSINENDEYLLIQNRFYNKNNILSLTGNLTNQQPFPVIFFRNDESYNEYFSFGGEDASLNVMRLIILADSQFQLDAVVSIFKDQKGTYYPLFLDNEMPFNSIGALKYGSFNYLSYKRPKIDNSQSVFIRDVRLTRFNSTSISEIKKINTQVYVGIIDVYTEYLRYPRCS